MAAPVSNNTKIKRVCFYFSAHQDDWQLFMTPAAFKDVLDPTAKCVFVHLTAGDAGLGTGTGGRKHPLYLARENGAEIAIRFMATGEYELPERSTAETVTLNGHAVRCVRHRNTVAYFLRVPDGNASGDGYAETGWQSLRRLAEGMIDTMTAVDPSASYRGWPDFVATLRALIDGECAGAESVDIHVPETDLTLNPNDHSDHLMTARAACEAAADLTRLRILHHVGYASSAMPENLNQSDRDMKCAVYAVTLAGVLAFDHAIAWQHYDQSFIGRDYCRIEERAP